MDVPRVWMISVAVGIVMSLAPRYGRARVQALARFHTGLACTSCHAGQRPSGRDVRCTSSVCHPRLQHSFGRTRHDRAHLGSHHPKCRDCHLGHPVRVGRAALAGRCERVATTTCVPCHIEQQAGRGTGILLYRTAPSIIAPGVHGSGSRTKRCSGARVSCFSCHGVHDVCTVSDPASPVNRRHVAATCGRCHRREEQRYRMGVHGRGAAAGIRVAPTCISCHGAHGIERVSAEHSPTGKARVVFTCADCHEDPRVIHAADLPMEIVDTYERTLHGEAYTHGVHDVATCVTCHGAHLVVPVTDPRSPVHQGRIRQTCLNCHTTVTPLMIERIMHHRGPAGAIAVLKNTKVYFPVAGTAMNPLLASGIGGLVGFLSGIFGVGGGFLMTPLLIFIGIPAAVAAATDSAQITAGASSGMFSHARFGHVDFKMGLAMVAGGWPGGFLGVRIVHALRTGGSFDFYLKFVYVMLLGWTGSMMLVEGVRVLRGRSARGEPGPGRLTRLFERLPFQLDFPKSGLRTSVLEPVAVGLLVGVLAAFLGVGGGFMLIPAMVYIIGIPTRMAVGTGLFQEVLVCAFVTIQQSATNHTVDLILAVALFLGSTIGAQFGVLANRHLRGEQIRVLLAVIILAVMVALLYQLVVPPHLMVGFARAGGGGG